MLYTCWRAKPLAEPLTRSPNQVTPPSAVAVKDFLKKYNVSNGVMTVYGDMTVGPYRLYFACEQAFGRILVFKTVITPLLTLVSRLSLNTSGSSA